MAESEIPDEKQAAFRDSLQERTKEAYKERSEKQESLLSEIAEDDELGNTDTCEIGSVTIHHKTWIPGEDLEQLQRAKQALDENDADAIDDEEIKLLTNLTEKISGSDDALSNDNEISEFWNSYLRRYGIDGIKAVNDRMLGPIMQETKDKADALQSFPEQRQGSRDGDGHGHDRHPSK